MFCYHEKIITWVKYQTESICKSTVNNICENNAGYVYLGYS